MLRTIAVVIALIIALSLAPPLLADQTQISNYNAARPIFWNQLYSGGGFTLYCAQPFSRKLGLEIEHVYPAGWMVQHLGCSSRRACQQNVPRFNRMEADLHNLFPSRSGTNRARSNRSFGEVANEPREFGTTCDFEVDTVNDIAEPPLDARGDVARAIFYMHQEYGLPIQAGLLSILKVWNQEDPPGAEERRRNDAIERLQDTRNPFIDQPGLGNTL